MSTEQSRHLLARLRQSPELIERPGVKQFLIEQLKARPADTLSLFSQHDLPMLRPCLEKAGIDETLARQRLAVGGEAPASRVRQSGGVVPVRPQALPEDPFEAHRLKLERDRVEKPDDPFDAARPPVEDRVLDVMDDMLVSGPKPFGLM